MKIPEQLHDFAEPTFILVADSEAAKVFLAKGRQVIPISDIFADDLLPYDKQKGIRANKGVVGVVESLRDDKLIEESKKKFFIRVNNYLLRKFTEGAFDNLVVFVPGEYKNEFKDRLHDQLKKRLKALVPKDLINQPLMSVLEHLENLKDQTRETF